MTTKNGCFLLAITLMNVFKLLPAASTTPASATCAQLYEDSSIVTGKVTFTHNNGTDNVIFTEHVLFERNARFVEDCGLRCANRDDCVFFTFLTGSPTGSCLGHDLVMTLADVHLDTPGARSYIHNAALSCNPYYRGYSLQYGRCVKLFPQRKQYNESEQLCGQDGGHLLDLLDTETEHEIQLAKCMAEKYGVDAVWVGLNDKQEDDEFRWTDGTLLPLDSNLWARDKPLNHTGRSDCVVMHFPNARLTNLGCDEGTTRPFICQTDV